jgi:hypothetical protein
MKTFFRSLENKPEQSQKNPFLLKSYFKMLKQMDQYLRLYVPVAEVANRISISNRNLRRFPPDGLRFLRTALTTIGVEKKKIVRIKVQGEPGTYKLVLQGQDQNNDENEDIDIFLGVEDLTYNANLLNFLRRMKLSLSPALREKEKELKSEYTTHAHGFHKLMRLKVRMRNSRAILERYESPATVEALQTILDQEPTLKKPFDKFLENLKASYVFDPVDPKPFGDWIKKEGFNGTTDGLQTLFTFINRHKRDIGGCWAVKASGNPCLVTSLSCNTTKNQSTFVCDRDPRCGPDNRRYACYQCLKWNFNRTCQEEPQCENTDTSCSNGCSNKNIEVPGDTILVCVNRIFWTAAQDYMNKYFTIAPKEEENEIVPVPKEEENEIIPVPVPVPGEEDVPVPVPGEEENEIVPVPKPPDEHVEEEKEKEKDDKDVREEKSGIPKIQIVFIGIGILIIFLVFIWNRMK